MSKIKSPEEWLKDWESGMRVSNIRLDKLAMLQAYHEYVMKQLKKELEKQSKFGTMDYSFGIDDCVKIVEEKLKK